MKKSAMALILLLLAAGISHSQTPQYSYEQFLNVRSAWGGQFFPKADRALFLSDITGVAQAYLIDASGGWPQQISFFPDGVSGASISRDGSRILIATDVGGNERDQFRLTSPMCEAPRRITFRDDVIHSFGGWSHDLTRFAYTSNERDQSYFDVFIFDLNWGTSKLLYQRDRRLSCYGWSPDDRYLVVGDVESSYNNNLYLVEIESGNAKLITPHDGLAFYSGIHWTPDGRGFYLATDQDREFTGLAYYDLANSSLNWVETPSWDVEGLDLSEDGRLLAWTVNEEGYMKLHIRDLRLGRDLAPPPMPEGNVGGFSFSKDGSRLIFSFGTATRPNDVWIYHLGAEEVSRLTQSTMAGINPGLLSQPQLVHYPSFDGRMIPGFLYLPPGAQKGDSLPVLVKIHGGPESQTTPRFSTSTQYFTHRGIAVFEPNVRGSTGYGKTYTHLDDVEKRLDSVRDMEYGARWLIELGYAHPGKLAVMGGSYGGYMVLAALTEQPDLWAAGVDIVGIANYVTFLENTGAWRRSHREAEYGTLSKDRELLKSISPIHKVDRIKAPLMVIQGANDPRVPKEEADQIVNALKKRKQAVEYLLYHDEGHGISKLENKLDAYPKMADFLIKHLGVD